MKAYISFLVGVFFTEAAFKLFFLATNIVPKVTPNGMAWDTMVLIGLAVWGLVLSLKKDPNDNRNSN